MVTDPHFKCPCSSGKLYEECCAIYHQGKAAESAEKLMRSRYSAYALNNVDYIVQTTHPRHPAVSQNLSAWKEAILNFSLNTDFERLEVLSVSEQADKAMVVFIAHLKDGDEDATFTECSYFAKVDGVWLYVNGDVTLGAKQ